MKFLSSGIVDYELAMADMDIYFEKVRDHTHENLIWFLEHPSLYTVGNNCDDDSVPDILPVYSSKRGGQLTYHGPGQLVVYFVYKLTKKDLMFFITELENIILSVLSKLGLKGNRKNQRGIWIEDKKIAFIGLYVRQWIVTHGIAFNIDPDLNFFDHIVPCGLKNQKITSLQDLKIYISRYEVENLFKKAFLKTFAS